MGKKVLNPDTYSPLFRKVILSQGVHPPYLKPGEYITWERIPDGVKGQFSGNNMMDIGSTVGINMGDETLEFDQYDERISASLSTYYDIVKVDGIDPNEVKKMRFVKENIDGTTYVIRLA